MNRNIRDILFCCIVFGIAFNMIPSAFQIPFWAGQLGAQLEIYPLIIGFVYFIYCQIRYSRETPYLKEFMTFFLIYLIVGLGSTIYGLINYPYYQQVLNGPVDQIAKLPYVLTAFHELGINVNKKDVVIVWMALRAIKSFMLESLYTFGAAYILFCWYYKDLNRALRLIRIMVSISLTLIAIYGIIDAFYLSGNAIAESILKQINPWLHAIKLGGTWWPPLLWKDQLRSIFAEPSFLGMYLAFAFPVLWNCMCVDTNKMQKIAYTVLCSIVFFEVILTNSRTAIALIFGELIIFLVFVVYLRNKSLVSGFGWILVCGCIAVLGGYFYNNEIGIKANKQMIESENIGEEAELNYIEENLISIVDDQKAGIHAESNKTRKTIMTADFRIGMDNPLFGVGYSLRSAYVSDYLPDDDQLNNETKAFRDRQKSQGILKTGYSNLRDYAVMFAERGIIGLFLFLLPSGVLVFKLLSEIKQKNLTREYQISLVFIFIALCGGLANGLGNWITCLYGYWIVLAIGYICVYNLKTSGISDYLA